MKSPDDANFQQWNENPEPALPTPDGRTILELETTSDAYLWESHNSQEGWLQYNGDLIDITR